MRTVPTIIAWALALTGCDPLPAQLPKCLESVHAEGVAVARVGDVPITMAQVLQEIREQGALAMRTYSSPKRLRQYVEDQVRFELLVRAALERGLHNDPDVIAAAQKVMVRKLLQRDMGPKVFEGKSTDKAIKVYYNRHREDYRQPEKRRIAHIQLSSTDDGRALGQSLLDRSEVRPHDRKRFKLLAARHSKDRVTRDQGGELPFLAQDEMAQEFGPSFAAEVFRMAPGELSTALLQSRRGWHVVRILAQRDALVRELDDVRDEIRERMLKGRRTALFEDYLADIRRRHPVVLYEKRLPELLSSLEETWQAGRP